MSRKTATKSLSLLAATLVAAAAVALPAGAHAQPAPATLIGHPVQLDPAGKLLSWLPQEGAFDGVARRSLTFLQTRINKEDNGLPSYLTYCCIDPKGRKGFAWPHNPAGFFAMMVESAVTWQGYTGDSSLLTLVGTMLDHQLAKGTTPKDWSWGSVPYASSDHGSVIYRGAHEMRYDATKMGRGDGYGVIEPDKVGELGIGYLRYWMATGKTKYRDAALACATALAKHVRAGDDKKSPWPFRVYAETDFVREEYTTSLQGPLRLLDEVIRLKLGDVAAFTRARAMAWDWFIKVPLVNGEWANYFEDISTHPDTKNWNNINPTEMAIYVMEPGRDPQWREHAVALIAYDEKHFGGDIEEKANDTKVIKEKGQQWGATAISEQVAYKFKMGSHTSRYATAQARFAELTGDAAAREKAFRSLNWASYMCQEDGLVMTGPNEHSVWFTDGYGDYARHFLSSMASMPEWAPPRQDHLLRSSSIVQKASYAKGRVTYTTFDAAGNDVLRLSFKPKSIKAGAKALTASASDAADGYTVTELPGGDTIVRIKRSASNTVSISAQ